jgi:hypothetical protein
MHARPNHPAQQGMERMKKRMVPVSYAAEGQNRWHHFPRLPVLITHAKMFGRFLLYHLYFTCKEFWSKCFFALTGKNIAVKSGTKIGTWRSLVAHLNGVQGVASSNPAVPTIFSSQKGRLAVSQPTFFVTPNRFSPSLVRLWLETLPMEEKNTTHRSDGDFSKGLRVSATACQKSR